MRLFPRILLVALLATPALAQTPPAPTPAIPGVPQLPAVPDEAALKKAAEDLKNSGIDAAASKAKDVLPGAVAPGVDIAAEVAKNGVLATPGGLLVAGAGGAVYNITKGITDALGDISDLRAKIQALEQENAKKDVDILFLKTKVAEIPKLQEKLDKSVTVLTELIEAHNKRLNALEAKVAALQGKTAPVKPGKPTKVDGSVTAPFVVVDSNGIALFTVDEDGKTTISSNGQAGISMKASGDDSAFIQLAAGDKTALVATDSGDGATLQLNDTREATVQISASQGKNGFIRVAGGKSNAIINADPDNAATVHLQAGPEAGLVLSSKPADLGLLAEQGGKSALSLGALPGKGIALRLFNPAGKQVVSAGPNPEQGGSGVVVVGPPDGARAGAKMEAQADGSAFVQAFGGGGDGGSALVGKENAVVAYNKAGNPVASIGKSDKSEGGTVVARNPTGEGIFAAGFASESGGGEACVWRAKRSNTFCLGLGLPGMGVGK